MDRTDCNRLVKLCALAAPFFFAACTQRDSAPAETAAADAPPITITVAPLPEVVVTASRLRPEEVELHDHEQRRRLFARRDR